MVSVLSIRKVWDHVRIQVSKGICNLFLENKEGRLLIHPCETPCKALARLTTWTLCLNACPGSAFLSWTVKNNGTGSVTGARGKAHSCWVGLIPRVKGTAGSILKSR